ncbi:hypothetical protein D3C76_808810 [compost metagenome]
MAIGAAPMELKIPGSQLTKVTNSHDVLSGEAMVSGDVRLLDECCSCIFQSLKDQPILSL